MCRIMGDVSGNHTTLCPRRFWHVTLIARIAAETDQKREVTLKGVNERLL